MSSSDERLNRGNRSFSKCPSDGLAVCERADGDGETRSPSPHPHCDVEGMDIHDTHGVSVVVSVERQVQCKLGFVCSSRDSGLM